MGSSLCKQYCCLFILRNVSVRDHNSSRPACRCWSVTVTHDVNISVSLLMARSLSMTLPSLNDSVYYLVTRILWYGANLRINCMESVELQHKAHRYFCIVYITFTSAALMEDRHCLHTSTVHGPKWGSIPRMNQPQWNIGASVKHTQNSELLSFDVR